MVETSSYRVEAGATYWLTGLSGAGKSTLSEAVKARLDKELGDDNKVFILDGDVIRTGLNKGLGFSDEDRTENIRRIAEVSKLFNMAGQIVFVAFISPFAAGRDSAKELHHAAGLKFYEGHVSATLEVCEKRDVKGLYAKARAGIIPKFTGVSDTYDVPTNPAINIDTGAMSLDVCVNKVIAHMTEEGVLSNKNAPRVVASLTRVATEAENAAAAAAPSVEINEHQAQYLQTVGDGWAYPLTRFMNEMELLESMQMKTVTTKDGKRHLLSVPITMHVTDEQKAELTGASLVSVKWNGEIVATISKPVFFENRKEEICSRTFGSFSPKHSGAEPIMKQGNWLVSGESMHFMKRVLFNDGMDCYRYTPKEINELIKAKNADAVYAFQVRNPLHNGHCLLLNDTRVQLLSQGFKNPILLLHPLGGWCKDDDVPLDTRMKQH
jgi:3'-phosphoadenosine 5'-phosphosulfate synthase